MEDVYMKEFSNRLIELRQQKGVSARDMSLSLGQTHNYINSIESGKNFPSMQTFFYICEYLEIKPYEFFDYEHDDPKGTDELYNEIRKMDVELERKVLELAKEINEKTKGR